MSTTETCESTQEISEFKDEILNINTLASQYSFNTLVLSGGGSKGFAMLGAVQYLYDKGYMDNVINFIGTSIGSIINYLLVIGMKPDEIISYLCTHKITDKLKHFNLVAMINRQGALSYSIIQETLEKVTLDKVGYFLTLKDLKTKFNKNLVCVTYNLTDDKVEFLSYENYPDMPVLIALRMSANIPFIFEDFKYFNKYYIDGGILDNFPIDYFDRDDNIICGINLKGQEKFNHQENVAEYFLKVIQIPLNKYSEEKVKKASSRCKIIELEIPDINFTKFDINNHQKLELFSQGYEVVKEYFEK